MRKEMPSEYIDKIINDIKQKNRFRFNKEFRDLLDFICVQYITTIKKETPLYRARIYIEPDRFDKYHYPEKYSQNLFFGFDEDNSYVNKDTSKIPEGRINPKGIPYLYAAFDIDTAIKEVKSYAKTAISVAEIELLEDLHVVDLCQDFGIASDPWDADFSMMLCSRFSEPVYYRDGYLLTQHISEYIKNEKHHDGVAFLSAFSNYDSYSMTKKGKNITIFNYEKCRPINSSLYLVKNVEVTIAPFK